MLSQLGRSTYRHLAPLLKLPEHPVVLELARQHGVSAAQVVLRWHLQRGHAAVPKSLDPAHVRDNAELSGVVLGADEMAALAKLDKGLRAERFLKQAFNNGGRAMP